MISHHEERNGVTKIYWSEIREKLSTIVPGFVKIVDQLSPDKTFPLYLVYLPYGSLKGDTLNTYFPDGKGNYYKLSDEIAPRDLVKNLSYGMDGSPMGMVLEKQLEYFIDLKDKKITIPWLVYSPGEFFPFSTILGINTKRIYAPNGLLTATAGTRSTFLLPNIGCNTHFLNLQRAYNIKTQAPKTLYDQWFTFKNVLQHSSVNDNWRACLLYFGEKWVNSIHHDKEWLQVKLFLYESAWRKFEYERNRIYYDIAFSLIQEKRNLKPNPYLTDTAKHLFTIALGAAPGFVPAIDEEAFPVELMQQIFIDVYGLKKYFPTIMRPIHFDCEKDRLPIYYSMQQPSTYSFSPKSREVNSTLSEMRELEHIMSIFCEELGKNATVCSDTILGQVANKMKLNYFHNKPDSHGIISSSVKIVEKDTRFNVRNNLNAKFANDAPFVRGCVSISMDE